MEGVERPLSFKGTGLSIVVGLVLASCFYFLYGLLFRFVVSLFASYDPSFGTGFGALIFLVLAPHVLSFLSAVIVTVRIFPRANRVGLFYGLAVLVSLSCLIEVITEFLRPDASLFTLFVLAAVWMLTILAMRLVLLSEEWAI